MTNAASGTVVVSIEELAGPNARHVALKLMSAGFWPVVIHGKGTTNYTKDGPKKATGKEPIGLGWGLEKATADHINALFDEYPTAGVGICFGPGRAPHGGWLIDVEGDGPGAEATRAKLLGGDAPATAGWASTRGGHGLMVVHDEARMLAIQAALGRSGVIKDKKGESNLPGLEIRVGGFYSTGAVIQLQSVCPPTPGTDGVPRQWHNIEVIEPVPEEFYTFLEGLAAEKAAKSAPKPTAATIGQDDAWNGEIDIVDAERLENARTWLMKKLVAFAATVAAETKGNRRTSLRNHVYTLAGILAHPNNLKYHLLDEQDVIDKMTAAADECGLEPQRRNDAMNWALEKGKEEPHWPEPLKLFDDDWKHQHAHDGQVEELDDELGDDPAEYGGYDDDNSGDEGPLDDPAESGSPPPGPDAHAAGGDGKKAGAKPPPTATNDYSKLTEAQLGIIWADDVEVRPITWAWPYRMALGSLTMIAGEGGQGKSQLALYIAERITNGGQWADGSGCAPVGTVLIISAEDGCEDTIKPRLVALGADMKRCAFVTAQVVIERPGKETLIDPQSLQSLGYWEEILTRITDVRMVLFDALPGFLGRNVDDHRNAEVRAVIEPFLKRIVMPRELLMLAVTHINKNIDARTPTHRISGSIAYYNLPRNVHIAFPDGDNPGRKIFGQIKSNNAAENLPSLAYRIEKRQITHKDINIETTVPVFEAKPVHLDIQDALVGGRHGPEAVRASTVAKWLRDYLNDEPTALADIIEEAGCKSYIGKKAAKDGRWSNMKSLYRGRDALPKIGAPGEQRYRVKVTETVVPVHTPTPGVKTRVFWQLEPIVGDEPEDIHS